MTVSRGSLSERLRARARQNPARIVLPEGLDPRVVCAAGIIQSLGIAEVTLLGDVDAVATVADEAGADLTGIACLDPATDPHRADLARLYLQHRSGSGESLEMAYDVMADAIYFGVGLLASNAADGMVAGARTATGATIEPALRMRRLAPGMGPIASFFLMELPPDRPNPDVGDVLVFADCALNRVPSAAMLARIAIVAADAAADLCGLEPRVALLSSSTKGSGEGERIAACREALIHLRRRAPHLQVDGELQVDAAVVESVGRLKAPRSTVAGRANVLVFPDLESGNIAYKLVERFAGARAIGPIFAGLNWPINDLSRGCSVEDVVDVVAATVIQSQDNPQRPPPARAAGWVTEARLVQRHPRATEYSATE